MNDPWDVKSVRHSDQYISCMKINGVPLLPPVLSKECRQEMQYYKMLAKEVEKRISMLTSSIYHEESDGEFSENSFEIPQAEIDAGFDINIDKITAITSEKVLETYSEKSPTPVNSRRPSIDVHNNITSNIMVVNNHKEAPVNASPKLVIDLNLSVNDNGKQTIENINRKLIQQAFHDLPVKDLSSPIKIPEQSAINFSFCYDDISESLATHSHDGPSSLSTKSFTGSLNEIHLESVKEARNVPKLVRQRSYTVLHPSPQLIAHIEGQSISTGVDVNSISMSESLCELDSSCKKRRSWDLETAKIKWSSMAVELSKTKVNDSKKSPGAKKLSQNQVMSSPYEMVKRTSLPSKLMPKSEKNVKSKKTVSPSRFSSVTRTALVPSSASIVPKKEPGTPKSPPSYKLTVNGKNKSETIETNNNDVSHVSSTDLNLISNAEDPATKVREIYEKIQKQQLMQMAILVEKQKKEQMHLQQVFEQQNKALFNQLKMICPKSPIPVKEAWGDVENKPVSLSQLINNKAQSKKHLDSTISSTLTLTGNQISDCDDLLKRSKELTKSIVKQQRAHSQDENQAFKPSEESRTKTNSPTQRQTPASRKLKYDTSASSDREIEPILTDRTNDTFADLNVTFPSDNTEECRPLSHCSMSSRNDNTTDRAIRTMEEAIHNSMNTMCARMKSQPTSRQIAAASTIVAYAKGYLTRRLMRTERVQSTVQTIRDALLCALELHQDKSGIRGADVDLHRRLIQQITAACYSLHDTFITSTAQERCAMIAADRGRRQSLASRQTPISTRRQYRPTDAMSKSHSGVFPAQAKRQSSTLSSMTQSNYEIFSANKSAVVSRGRHLRSPSRRPRPWR